MADALKNLDPSIKNWIQSDGVFKTILDLNKELGCYGEELSVISQAIISVSLGQIKPENLILEIAKGLPFLEDKKVENAVSVLKKKFSTRWGLPSGNMVLILKKSLPPCPPRRVNRPPKNQKHLPRRWRGK